MKNFGEFFNNQIEHAGTVILSRTQNVSEEKLKTAIELIKSVNPNAHIITTPWADIDGTKILGAMENFTNLELDMLAEAAQKAYEEHEKEHHHHHHHEDGECCCCGGHHDDDDEHEHHHDHEHEHHHDHEHDHHHHHADDVFTSWGTETPKKYEKAELDSILKKLSESEDYGKVLRSKGMLPCTDGTWMYFDLVPEEYEIREGSADFTGRICVIGSELKEDALKELFEV